MSRILLRSCLLFTRTVFILLQRGDRQAENTASKKDIDWYSKAKCLVFFGAVGLCLLLLDLFLKHINVLPEAGELMLKGIRGA